MCWAVPRTNIVHHADDIFFNGLSIKTFSEHLEAKWPGSYLKTLRTLTQKCTDAYNNKKLLHLRDESDD